MYPGQRRLVVRLRSVGDLKSLVERRARLRVLPQLPEKVAAIHVIEPQPDVRPSRLVNFNLLVQMRNRVGKHLLTVASQQSQVHVRLAQACLIVRVFGQLEVLLEDFESCFQLAFFLIGATQRGQGDQRLFAIASGFEEVQGLLKLRNSFVVITQLLV